MRRRALLRRYAGDPELTEGTRMVPLNVSHMDVADQAEKVLTDCRRLFFQRLRCSSLLRRSASAAISSK